MHIITALENSSFMKKLTDSVSYFKDEVSLHSFNEIDSMETYNGNQGITFIDFSNFEILNEELQSTFIILVLPENVIIPEPISKIKRNFDSVIDDSISITSLKSLIDNHLRFSYIRKSKSIKTWFDTLPIGLFRLCLEPDEKVVYLNNKILSMLGYTFEEIHNLKLCDFFDDSELRENLREIIYRDKKISNVEMEVKRKNGSRTWVKWSGTLREIDQQLFLDGAVENIDELISLRKEHKGLEDQLKRSQKLEAIGVLTGGIAHDFNNILTPIMAYSEMAMYKLSPSNIIYKDLKEIEYASRKGKKLISQLMSFSRKTESVKQVSQLKPIIKEAIDLIRASIPSNIELITLFDRDCGYVMAEPTKIHQVIVNFCTNASHAIDGQNGKIRIKLEKKKLFEDDLVAFDKLLKGVYNIITIEDSGKGIPAEHLQHIFDPFYTTKTEDKGTGLGLSVAKRIIHNHNGEISVSSNLKKGTTFKIFLPTVKYKAKNVEKDNDVHFMKGNGENILVIDDDVSVTKALRRTLEFMGYHVTQLNNSFIALDKLKSAEVSFKLVISDFMMPELNGIQLSHAIREFDTDTPIIILTGNEEKINNSELEKCNISDVIRKPVSIQGLSNALYKALTNKKR